MKNLIILRSLKNLKCLNSYSLSVKWSLLLYSTSFCYCSSNGFLLGLSFLSSSVKFWYLSQAFFTFCLFLFQKDFDIFHLLFLVFLCVFDNKFVIFIDRKKIVKNIYVLQKLILVYEFMYLRYVSFLSFVHYMS